MDNVVPILTGERRASVDPPVALSAYNLVLDKYDETWRELANVTALLEAAEDEIDRLNSERRRGPSRYLVYAGLFAAGVLIGWLLGRMVP